jgi:predicted alternative tryptophan synthase beta-subunit
VLPRRHQGQEALDQLERCEHDSLGSIGERALESQGDAPVGQRCQPVGFGDTAKLTPLVKMHTLGSSFIPAPIHAGGLRYHGMAPLVCRLYDDKVIEAVAVRQTPVFEAAVQFARAEGIVPAPESSHAIRVTIDEALKSRQSGTRSTILFK